jgi:hypothetical protein
MGTTLPWRCQADEVCVPTSQPVLARPACIPLDLTHAALLWLLLPQAPSSCRATACPTWTTCGSAGSAANGALPCLCRPAGPGSPVPNGRRPRPNADTHPTRGTDGGCAQANVHGVRSTDRRQRHTWQPGGPECCGCLKQAWSSNRQRRCYWGSSRIQEAMGLPDSVPTPDRTGGQRAASSPRPPCPRCVWNRVARGLCLK